MIFACFQFEIFPKLFQIQIKEEFVEKYFFKFNIANERKN